jgi:uncharacterized membrane protein
MLKGVEAESRLPREAVSLGRVGSFALSARAVVWLAAGTYAVVAASAAVLDFVGFRTARFDLGNASQAIWSTTHGQVLEMTGVQGTQFVRLGSHVEPLLLLFTPLWLVWSSPITLVVLQAVAVSAGALPVFWLARKHLGSERAALFFALAYLLYPPTQWNALDPNLGFHAVSLALPLLLYALWWLDEERLGLFAVAAVLAAATNEQVPVIVGCLGLWYGVRRRRPVLGIAIFITGLAITAADFLFVVPHFNPAGSGPFADRYTAVGGTPSGIVKTAITHPLRIADVVLTEHKLGYLALLVIPLLGLFFRAPLLLLAAVPPLAINLLSSSNDQTRINGHYAATTTAVLVAAAIFGAARFAKAERVSIAILTTACIAAVISPLWTAVPVARDAIVGTPVLRAERHAINLVPDGVPVSVSNIIGAHLSARRRVVMFPDVHGAQWVAVDFKDTEGGSSFRPVIDRLRTRRTFIAVYETKRVIVMRRR